ncbi:SPRY domain-containing protein 3 isoform X3 [Entelurus aequoreus]|uniref:SPRY domain-containing protein 3 isoform X3 n=1 Tax=Entelurus aequoreus TaxID=161455 RepID=UPI002B1E07B8|nr:SPRY domain-containing protein 3 isoform X3 [Entelurus aequoreus]
MEDINPGQRCLPNLRRRIRDIGDGHPAQERYMRLLKDGDTLSYQGNSEEVGCYVAGHPLSKGNCYFEVTIVDTGVRGTIAVGLVHKFYRLDHQPGWLPYSVAYHADNGKLYNGNPVGQQFGPKCARGDRIGCGIYPKTIEAGFKTVFFTKNGKEVGSVDVLVMAEGLFPAVGMHSMGEEVKVDLQAEWLLKEDDTMMMVDSHEDDWGRLTDVRVSGTDYPRNRHPGWSRGSVAYHADDGKVFHGSGVGDVFGPRCFKGDIMGCGIMFPRDYILNGDADDWDQMEVFSGQADIQNIVYLNLDEEVDEEEDGDREAGQDGRKVMVFFTRNRKLVGRREMALPPGGLYPTVGMLSNGEKVKVDLHPLSG